MGVVVTSEPGEYQGAFSAAQRHRPARLELGEPVRRPQPDAVISLVTLGAGPYSSDCFEHGPSRRDGVRYDTPTWHGFIFSAAWGEDDFWDAAIRYAGEWHGFRLAAGTGIASTRTASPTSS